MDLILTQDVPHLGKKHTVVSVKKGYGRNYLLPRGYAHLATEASLAHAIGAATKRAARLEQMQTQSKEIAQKLKNLNLTMRKKGTAKGHLYGSITNRDIAKLIAKDHGINLDPDSIILPKPIKAAGKSKLTVQLSADTTATLTVSVESDTTKK